MRKDVEQILRREELEKTLKETKKKLKEIKSKCHLGMHKLGVVTQYDKEYNLGKCLFCGGTLEYLFDGEDLIKCTNEKEKVYSTSKLRFELVKKLYVQIAIKHPRMKMKQIIKLVQDQIDDRGKEFCKIAKELNVKYEK